MRRRSGGQRRRGLVLGAGGYLGAAWTLGALAALQEATDWDVTTADLIVGTSAGAVLTMLLRAGITVDDLYADQLGAAVGQRAQAAEALDSTGGSAAPEPTLQPVMLPDFGSLEPALPSLPRLGVGSWPLLTHAVRNPSRVRPAALCAALVPQGRRRLTTIETLIDDLLDPDDWPADTQVVATNYRWGSRAVFGRSRRRRTTPARAVTASCAVPGWYRPVEVDRVPYIDGAVYSPCNADVARECDEVFVLAPMASLHPDRPSAPLARLERWWRRTATARTLAEVRRLEAGGARVHLFTPNAEELTVMGTNMMDGSRRAEVLRTARAAVARQLAEPAAEPALESALESVPTGAATDQSSERVTGLAGAPARPRLTTIGEAA